MQAIILSAGFSTRLKPLTDALPKVMLPIGGKPLLEHQIEQLKRHGVREIFINLHFLPEVITNYFGNGSRFGVKIFYKFEPKILGTAGGIKNFKNEISGPFFTVYGDILNFINYAKFKERFDEIVGAVGIGIVGDTDHPHDSDLVEVDKDLRFLRIHPKPHKKPLENHKSMKGVYIFKKEILDYIPENTYYEIDHQLLPDILNRKLKFYGYETEGYLKDIGTTERYQKAQEDYFEMSKN